MTDLAAPTLATPTLAGTALASAAAATTATAVLVAAAAVGRMSAADPPPIMVTMTFPQMPDPAAMHGRVIVIWSVVIIIFRPIIINGTFAADIYLD